MRHGAVRFRRGRRTKPTETARERAVRCVDGHLVVEAGGQPGCLACASLALLMERRRVLKETFWDKLDQQRFESLQDSGANVHGDRYD